MKKTEKIAKTILEKRGKVFDGTYFDDGSSESMPDLKYANGRFVEITQTNHNNGLFCDDEDAHKRAMKRQKSLDKLDPEAYRRYMTNDYPDGCGHSRSSDEKILKETYGWNKDTQTFGSEFGSLLPVVEYSVDIISKVIKRKHKKHKKHKDIELFVFVTEEEFDMFEEVIENSQWNSTDKKILEEICSTCFRKIYISVYNLEKQDYTYSEDKFIEINCEVKK
jgi:hypothetical protein